MRGLHLASTHQLLEDLHAQNTGDEIPESVNREGTICVHAALCCGVQVNLNSVWSGMGLMENNLLGAQQETRLRVEELEDRWVGVHSAWLCELRPTMAIECKLQVQESHVFGAGGLLRQLGGPSYLITHIDCEHCMPACPPDSLLGFLPVCLPACLFACLFTHLTACLPACRLSKLHKKLDVLIKLFISSLGPSQALLLSRQATMGQGGPHTRPQQLPSSVAQLAGRAQGTRRQRGVAQHPIPELGDTCGPWARFPASRNDHPGAGPGPLARAAGCGIWPTHGAFGACCNSHKGPAPGHGQAIRATGALDLRCGKHGWCHAHRAPHGKRGCYSD
jgi:hypothetical protein